MPAGDRLMKVYLAGGFRSGWQKKVKEMAPVAHYLDPSTSGLTDPVGYTKWDLAAIDGCDVIFAYMEEDNPGGYALGLEIGYAKAQDKFIIFINEKTSINRYVPMLTAVASTVCADLIEGAAELRKLGKLKW